MVARELTEEILAESDRLWKAIRDASNQIVIVITRDNLLQSSNAILAKRISHNWPK